MSTNDIYDRLGGIDSKLDLILSRGDDHEGRLRVLETWKGRIVGALALIGVGLPLAVHLLK